MSLRVLALLLALVKIAGTDGALQPAEPITDELLCDEAGVAARQRGLNALSDSGVGQTGTRYFVRDGQLDGEAAGLVSLEIEV